MRLAHPARDELGVLGSEVDHEDGRGVLMCAKPTDSHTRPGHGPPPGAPHPVSAARRRSAPGASAGTAGCRGGTARHPRCTPTRAAAGGPARPCSARRHRPFRLRGDRQRRVDPEVGRDRRAVDHVQPRVAVHPVVRVDHARRPATRRSPRRRGCARSSGCRTVRRARRPGSRRSPRRAAGPPRLPAGIQVGFGAPCPWRGDQPAPTEPAAP